MLFQIIADYRPQNPNSPRYFVEAETKRETKKIFTDRISWLKIYDIQPYLDSVEPFWVINRNPKRTV